MQGFLEGPSGDALQVQSRQEPFQRARPSQVPRSSEARNWMGPPDPSGVRFPARGTHGGIGPMPVWTSRSGRCP